MASNRNVALSEIPEADIDIELEKFYPENNDYIVDEIMSHFRSDDNRLHGRLQGRLHRNYSQMGSSLRNNFMRPNTFFNRIMEGLDPMNDTGQGSRDNLPRVDRNVSMRQVDRNFGRDPRNNPGPVPRNNPGLIPRNNPGPVPRNDIGPGVGNDIGPGVGNYIGPGVGNYIGPGVGNYIGPGVGNDAIYVNNISEIDKDNSGQANGSFAQNNGLGEGTRIDLGAGIVRSWASLYRPQRISRTDRGRGRGGSSGRIRFGSSFGPPVPVNPHNGFSLAPNTSVALRLGIDVAVTGAVHVAPPGHIATPLGHVATPLGYVAPPLGRVAPPPGRVAPPPGRIAMPLGQVAPLLGHVAPPLVHVAPPPGHIAPPPVHAVPPPGHIAPPPVHVVPPPGHVAPPPVHVAPPPVHVAPPPGHVAPPPVHVAPPPGHIAPPPVHVAPPPGHVAPPVSTAVRQHLTSQLVSHNVIMRAIEDAAGGRLLSFVIEYRGNVYSYQIPDSTTIG